MSFLSRKRVTRHYFPRITRLAIIGFFIALAYAVIETIWAVYVNSFVNNEAYVSFIVSIFTIISLISYLLIVPLIQKSNKSRLFQLILLGSCIIYALLGLTYSFHLFLLLSALVTVVIAVRLTIYGIMVKHQSTKKTLPQNEGLVYTFSNVAWLIGPLIVALLVNYLTDRTFFFIAAFLFLLSFLFFRASKLNDNIKGKKIEEHPLRNLINFFKNRDRRIAYFLSGGVNFWWILIYIFVPLMIIKSGLKETYIGFFLFFVALPLILFEYKFSKMVKSKGFKKLFKIGYIIPAVIALICFFIPNLYIILVLLVLASVGLAMLEPTTEAYFLELLDGTQELRFYEVYNTSIDLNFFVAALISGIFLVFLPLKAIFLLFSGFMFIFFLVAIRTKNIKLNR